MPFKINDTYVGKDYLMNELLNTGEVTIIKNTMIEQPDNPLYRKIQSTDTYLDTDDLIENLSNGLNDPDLLSAMLTFSKAHILTILYLYHKQVLSIEKIKEIISTSDENTRSEILISHLSTLNENIGLLNGLKSKMQKIFGTIDPQDPNNNPTINKNNSDRIESLEKGYKLSKGSDTFEVMIETDINKILDVGYETNAKNNPKAIQLTNLLRRLEVDAKNNIYKLDGENIFEKRIQNDYVYADLTTEASNTDLLNKHNPSFLIGNDNRNYSWWVNNNSLQHDSDIIFNTEALITLCDNIFYNVAAAVWPFGNPDVWHNGWNSYTDEDEYRSIVYDERGDNIDNFVRDSIKKAVSMVELNSIDEDVFANMLFDYVKGEYDRIVMNETNPYKDKVASTCLENYTKFYKLYSQNEKIGTNIQYGTSFDISENNTNIKDFNYYCKLKDFVETGNTNKVTNNPTAYLVNTGGSIAYQNTEYYYSSYRNLAGTLEGNSLNLDFSSNHKYEVDDAIDVYDLFYPFYKSTKKQVLSSVLQYGGINVNSYNYVNYILGNATLYKHMFNTINYESARDIDHLNNLGGDLLDSNNNYDVDEIYKIFSLDKTTNSNNSNFVSKEYLNADFLFNKNYKDQLELRSLGSGELGRYMTLISDKVDVELDISDFTEDNLKRIINKVRNQVENMKFNKSEIKFENKLIFYFAKGMVLSYLNFLEDANMKITDNPFILTNNYEKIYRLLFFIRHSYENAEMINNETMKAHEKFTSNQKATIKGAIQLLDEDNHDILYKSDGALVDTVDGLDSRDYYKTSFEVMCENVLNLIKRSVPTGVPIEIK